MAFRGGLAAAYQQVSGFVAQDPFTVVWEDCGELVDEETQQARGRGAQRQHNDRYSACQVGHKEPLHADRV